MPRALFNMLVTNIDGLVQDDRDDKFHDVVEVWTEVPLAIISLFMFLFFSVIRLQRTLKPYKRTPTPSANDALDIYVSIN